GGGGGAWLGGGAAALSGWAKTVAAPTARPLLSTVRRETCVWFMPSLPVLFASAASLYLSRELAQPGGASVFYDSAPKMRRWRRAMPLIQRSPSSGFLPM